MKRFLLVFALSLLAFPVAGSELRDRDVLLTESGVVYTVDSVRQVSAENGRRPPHLMLTIQEGDQRVTAPVPASLTGGDHTNPALAYDTESETLFLFWQETLHRFSSRLLFASFHDGTWSDVTALDSVTYKLRRNLRIAVTRTIESKDEQGQATQMPQLVVHAVWWEETGDGEWARYAMLGIDNGEVTSTDFRYLLQFTGADVDPHDGARTTNEVLRHPAVFANSTRDSVEVVFGDTKKNTMHRVRIRPALDGRVRIPIGVRDRALRNVSLNVATDARVSAVIEGDDVALYSVNGGRLDYVLFHNDAWSAQRSIALSEDLPAQTAVEALRRMVATH